MQRARLLVTVALLLATPGVAAAADETSVSDLIARSEQLSGVEVTVSGELVGDYGFRDDGWMWTQLNGDAYVDSPVSQGGQPVGGNTGVGIRMPTRLGEGLDPPGGYRNRGPIVRVTGIWKHHDPARQGETYLEVESASVLETGEPMRQGPEWPAAAVGVGLLAASFALWRREAQNVTAPSHGVRHPASNVHS